MKIPGVHPNVARMLTRRGFTIIEIGRRLFVRNKEWVCPIADGIAYCRALNNREKQARYVKRHREQVNAYMREYQNKRRAQTEVAA